VTASIAEIVSEPDTRFFIIMLTDGLDNVSMQLARNNKRGKYSSLEQYGEKLQDKMETVLDKPKLLGFIPRIWKNKTNIFQSYVLLYKGLDLQANGFFDEHLRERLSPLTGAQNADVPVPLINEDFNELFNQFIINFAYSSLTFQVPKDYGEQEYRIRMVLRGNNGTEEADCILEGDMIGSRPPGLKGLFSSRRVYHLENLTVSESFTIEELEEDRVNEDNRVPEGAGAAQFIINKLRYKDKRFAVTSFQQWYYDGEWRSNSEATADTGSDRKAYILIIMDRSRSLGNDELQQSADMMIQLINSLIAIM
jgi:hypothetical protein